MKIIVVVDFMINSFDRFMNTKEGRNLFHLVMMVDTLLGIDSRDLIIKDNILRVIKEERALYQDEALIKKHLMSRDFWYDNLQETSFLEVGIVPELAIYSYFKSNEGIKLLAMVKSVFEQKECNKSVAEILRWTKEIIDINREEDGIVSFNDDLDEVSFWEKTLENSWEPDSSERP